MPYDLYWNGPINAYFLYAEKARLDVKRHINDLLDAAWMFGEYTAKALLSVYQYFNPIASEKSPRFPYPEKPERPKRELTPEEKEERKQIFEKMRKVNAELHPEEHRGKG
jgi:hypothetical protein